MRVLVTGAAGSGTTTLATALAERLQVRQVEADVFFWLPTEPPYTSKRDPSERNAMLVQELKTDPRCVVAGSVVGWGVEALLDLVVFLYVESEVRLRRLETREVARFGKANPSFLAWASQYDEGPSEGRSLAKHETWLASLACPVIRLVGELSVREQVALITQALPNPSVKGTSCGKPQAASRPLRRTLGRSTTNTTLANGNMTPGNLHPAQRFMYEFGCFTAFWSNFELMMEVGTWLHTGRSAKENCKLVNPKTAGVKKALLKELLLNKNLMEAHDALEKVFAVADRNGWVHGHVLNPNGDFTRLTRLRVELNGTDLKVDNTTIDVSASPFTAFYEAFGEFEEKSGISKDKCNEYIIGYLELSPSRPAAA